MGADAKIKADAEAKAKSEAAAKARPVADAKPRVQADAGGKVVAMWQPGEQRTEVQATKIVPIVYNEGYKVPIYAPVPQNDMPRTVKYTIQVSQSDGKKESDGKKVPDYVKNLK